MVQAELRMEALQLRRPTQAASVTAARTQGQQRARVGRPLASTPLETTSDRAAVLAAVTADISAEVPSRGLSSQYVRTSKELAFHGILP